ncbi:MAG TPA: AmmeMemoRadiSam system protein B [Desulfitobacterium dehalogenans]|uniref:AmmeMemoRadiSam system protein B n=1 Tax=Desulfitobacterium dehalogenans TaxID=36854 RepID=A0A7C7D6C1_9FIRM|nr:AmmeMemoRadiSam system protein B [Desulfitobacterium dehalogenans]
MEKGKGAVSILVIVCAAFLLLLSSGVGGEFRTEKNWAEAVRNQGTQNLGVSIHPSFVTQHELSTALAKGSTNPTFIDGRIISVVMPHHLVADRLIVNAMAALARQEPRLVIVVGPNHFNKGGKVITGASGWQTPAGILPSEENLVKHLKEKGLAVIDEEVLAQEHSIGALVPFIKHFLPESKILPIILHHDVSIREVDALLSGLAPLMDEKVVLIASVDFSHYLTRSEAQAKDLETLEVMKDFDYATLLRLNNDYVDSPISLATAFRLAEKEGIRTFTILDNTNSGIIMQNDTIETTSYFTLMFTQK